MPPSLVYPKSAYFVSKTHPDSAAPPSPPLEACAPPMPHVWRRGVHRSINATTPKPRSAAPATT
jgi:hypothetical protein